jgi:hypothetical protein
LGSEFTKSHNLLAWSQLDEGSSILSKYRVIIATLLQWFSKTSTYLLMDLQPTSDFKTNLVV